MTKKSKSAYIDNDELRKKKIRANLIQEENVEQNKQKELYNQSLERTSKWEDNHKDAKKRKQQQKYQKFERQQLQRRKIDQEYKQYKQKVKQNQLQKANKKIFQDTYKVRQQYKQSRKVQVKKRQNQKHTEKIDNENFKAAWQQKLYQLKLANNKDDNFRKEILRKNAETLKRQIEQKKKKNNNKQKKIYRKLKKQKFVQNIKTSNLEIMQQNHQKNGLKKEKIQYQQQNIWFLQ